MNEFLLKKKFCLWEKRILSDVYITDSQSFSIATIVLNNFLNMDKLDIQLYDILSDKTYSEWCLIEIIDRLDTDETMYVNEEQKLHDDIYGDINKLTKKEYWYYEYNKKGHIIIR